MMNSLYIGATGMAAQQVHIDAISNNVANVNTPGFKADLVTFQNLMYAATPGGPDMDAGSDLQRAVGMGSVALSLGKKFTSGELKKTDQPLDLGISGEGLVELLLPDGSSAYSRTLSLQVNRDGLLASADGYPLRQQITIPGDATAIQIDRSGKVMVSVPDEKAPVEAGQIELVRFVNPAGLPPLGSNLYGSSDKAGDPQFGKPGDSGFGTLSQG